MGLQLDVSSTSNDHRVLSVRGEVDIATVGELEDKIASLGDPSAGLVLDLTETEFMDSSGLRLIVSTHERFAAGGGNLRVAVGPGPIYRLLDITGLLGHLDVHDTVEEAASA